MNLLSSIDVSNPKTQTAILLVMLSFVASVNLLKKYRHKKGNHGTAAWAKPRDIKKMGLLTRNGPILGITKSRKYLTYNGDSHIAVIAPTGSGKGVGIVIPTLLSYPGSVLVIDLKGENYDKTAGFRSQFSKCFRFSPTMMQSSAFNPLDCIRKDGRMIGDAQMVASVLASIDSGMLEQAHWHDSAWALLVTVILYTLEHHPRKSLTGMLEVLNDPDKPIKNVLQDMLQSEITAVSMGARNLLNKSDNELSGIISTAARFLALYYDPIVAKHTDNSDFTIEQLMQDEKPLSVYLALPPPDLERTSSLFRLIVCLITKRLTETHDNDKNNHQLLIVYDEFTAFGKIEFFERALSYIRGYGIQAMLIAQGINQVRAVYGMTTSVLDQCECKVFFTPSDMVTAKEVSAMLGQQTIEERRRSYSRKHESWSDGSFGRPLMMPDEVATMPLDDELIFLKGYKPVKAKRFKYFEDTLLLKRVNLPTPTISRISLIKQEKTVTRQKETNIKVIRETIKL